MNLIKVKFLKNDTPYGRAYTYIANDDFVVGDVVQINESAKGIVVETNVDESEVIGFADKLKTVIGKAVD